MFNLSSDNAKNEIRKGLDLGIILFFSAHNEWCDFSVLKRKIFFIFRTMFGYLHNSYELIYYSIFINWVFLQSSDNDKEEIKIRLDKSLILFVLDSLKWCQISYSGYFCKAQTMTKKISETNQTEVWYFVFYTPLSVVTFSYFLRKFFDTVGPLVILLFVQFS